MIPDCDGFDPRLFVRVSLVIPDSRGRVSPVISDSTRVSPVIPDSTGRVSSVIPDSGFRVSPVIPDFENRVSPMTPDFSRVSSLPSDPTGIRIVNRVCRPHVVCRLSRWITPSRRSSAIARLTVGILKPVSIAREEYPGQACHESLTRERMTTYTLTAAGLRRLIIPSSLREVRSGPYPAGSWDLTPVARTVKIPS